MDVRDFTGAFLVDGRETEAMDLRIIVSTGGDGRRIGSGSFAVPPALAGRVDGGTLIFRTDADDEILLEVREFILTEGRVYFLTSPDLPVERGAQSA